MIRDNEEPVKKLLQKFKYLQRKKKCLVEVAKTRRGGPPKATKDAEKQAKRALVEEEALVEENLVETLSQRPKRLKK